MQTRPAIRPLAGIVFAFVMGSSVVSAQEVTYLGTVLVTEAARVQVRTVDGKTKNEDNVWFAVDKDTTVKRGDDVVAYPDAKITRGERIAVIVDPAAKTKMLALQIRLAPIPAMKGPPSAPPLESKPASPPSAVAHTEHQQAGQPQKPGGQMDMPSPGWQLMQDGVVYGLFNHQSGPRGGREFVVPNWWMGMLMRENGKHQLGLSAMLSLDPVTVGKSGYRKLFQAGEALDGKPLIDRQHPHDLFMQLAASWRLTLGEDASLTIAGAPVGEPTLGPVAFMHRASAAGLPLAPLGHHTFDSTHITFGVVSAALERGRWVFEGSAFNAREPDEDRWDFDFAPMDSVAGRVWFRPRDEWEIQVSSGRLREPEELAPGDIVRTTASGSWFRLRDGSLQAYTASYGINAAHGERRHGVFGEFTLERGLNSVSSRVELQQVETDVLLTGEIGHDSDDAARPATVAAVTFSAARRLLTWRGFEGALGAQVAFYGVPESLKTTHGKHPVSFQAFLRVRLPSGKMGRMWNMRMSQGHRMGSEHAGHVMR